MSETNPNVVWTYDVTDTSQDRHAPRTGIRAPLSSELTGVDPLYEGGLRPFSGFRQVHFFQLTSADHKVTDVFSGDFSIGTGYGYYFVYRVQDPVSSGGTSSDGSTIGKVYVDYWNSFTGDWTRKVLLVSGVPTSPAFDPVEGRQMNVVAVGRFIYVFIEGTRPVLFFVNGEAPYDQTIEDQTGPGKRPTLKSPENMSSLGSIVSTGVDDRPAAGGIYLTTTPPSGLMLGLGTGTSSSDGTITGQKDANCRLLEPGDYSFAFQLLDSVTGRKSALSEVAQARKEDFATGSSTLTAAPQISKYAALEICYDRTLFDQALVWRSVKTQDAGGIFVANILLLDRIINLDEFKTSNSISSSSSGEERLSQSIYYYELEDKQLVFQDTFQDETTFDEKMPYGGSAHWFDNTMLVSKIRSQAPSTEVEPRGEDSFRGIGETRYSSVYEYSPELFPPSNRLNPSLPSNNILLFRQIGQTVVGFSKDRQYLFRKDGTFLRMVEIHEGFGVINDKAADSVGSMVYFVTTKGVKSVDVSGQLDTVQALNHTILNSWSTSLASVSCAHDAGMSSFFVFNSEMDELVIFCMNTGKVCRIEDCPFEGVFRGVWPDNFTWDFEELRANDGIGNDTYRNQLVSRAMFWTNPSLSVYCPVYLVDYTRQRLKGYGPGASERQITLLPVDGDSVWEVHVAFTMGTDLYLKADSSKLLALSAHLAPAPSSTGTRSTWSGLPTAPSSDGRPPSPSPKPPVPAPSDWSRARLRPSTGWPPATSWPSVPLSSGGSALPCGCPRRDPSTARNQTSTSSRAWNPSCAPSVTSQAPPSPRTTPSTATPGSSSLATRSTPSKSPRPSMPTTSWPSPSSPPRSTRPTSRLSAPPKPPWAVATVSRGRCSRPASK